MQPIRNARFSSKQDGSLQCPTCKTIYGEKTGTQPPGKMEYHVIPHCLPGYADSKTIRIVYDIPAGIQVRAARLCENPPRRHCVMIRRLGSLNLCPFSTVAAYQLGAYQLGADKQRPVVGAGGWGVSRCGNSGVWDHSRYRARMEPLKSSERRSCQRRGRLAASEITPSHEFMIEFRKKKSLECPLRLWINKFASKKHLMLSSYTAGFFIRRVCERARPD